MKLLGKPLDNHFHFHFFTSTQGFSANLGVISKIKVTKKSTFFKKTPLPSYRAGLRPDAAHMTTNSHMA